MNLSKKELVAILDITAMTFNRYVTDGMGGRFGTGPKTVYDAKTVVEFHVQQQVAAAMKLKVNQAATSDLGTIPDKDTSDAIIAHWKAKREEARTLKEIGDLIPIETSQREIEHRLSNIRSVLDSIPAQFAPFVVGLTTLEQAQRVLSGELQNLYHTLSALPDPQDDAELTPVDDDTDE